MRTLSLKFPVQKETPEIEIIYEGGDYRDDALTNYWPFGPVQDSVHSVRIG